MEYQNKVRLCLQLLKQHIKNSELSYQSLSDRLGISLLTVKRQLNGEEISMTKLLALCDAAQLSFTELWQQVENNRPKHYEFTQAQDKAFHLHPHLFSYFMALQLGKLSPEQIQQQCQISAASTHVYLRKLEQLELIRLSARGRPTLLVTEPFGFSSDSLHFRKSIQSALRLTSDKVMQLGEGEQSTFVIAKPLALSDDLRDKMYEEMTTLVSRYAELSERYFVHSGQSAFQLVVCDYPIHESDVEPMAEIINITALAD